MRTVVECDGTQSAKVKLTIERWDKTRSIVGFTWQSMRMMLNIPKSLENNEDIKLHRIRNTHSKSWRNSHSPMEISVRCLRLNISPNIHRLCVLLALWVLAMQRNLFIVYFEIVYFEIPLNSRQLKVMEIDLDRSVCDKLDKGFKVSFITLNWSF